MSDEEPKIPEKFSLKQQLEELRSTYKSKHEFVHGRISAGKAVAPSKELALFSLARLAAAGRTLACLVEGTPIDSVPDGGKDEATEPVRDDAWWIKRIAEVAAELCRMGKPYSLSHLQTFIPVEHHHVLARLAEGADNVRPAPPPPPPADDDHWGD